MLRGSLEAGNEEDKLNRNASFFIDQMRFIPAGMAVIVLLVSVAAGYAISGHIPMFIFLQLILPISLMLVVLLTSLATKIPLKHYSIDFGVKNEVSVGVAVLISPILVLLLPALIWIYSSACVCAMWSYLFEKFE